jgi:hypothetical protein
MSISNLNHNAIIKRLRFYLQESNDAQNAVEMILDDCDSDELTEKQTDFVREEILVPQLVIRFAEHYEGICRVYPSDPDPSTIFQTFVTFEKLSEDLAKDVARAINFGAAEDDDGDEDEIDDNGVVFHGEKDWQELSAAERQAKVKLFLKKLSRVGYDAKEMQPFLKNLNVGKQANRYGSKFGTATKTFDRENNRFGHPNNLGNLVAPNEETELDEHTHGHNVGDRVQLHPATDRWMMGDRYGTVVKLGNKHVHVKMDKSNKTLKVHPNNIGDNYGPAKNAHEETLDEGSISFPNSSGQGHDADHDLHPLHKIAAKHGYNYSHTTPVTQRDGSTFYHHTWARGEHKIGAYDHDTKWSSKVSSSSGHLWIGIGTVALDKHLKNKAKRYQLQNNESVALTKIQEGLLDPQTEKIQRYADFMNKNRPTVFGHQIDETSQADELKKTWKMKEEQDKRFGIEQPDSSLFNQRSGKPR